MVKVGSVYQFDFQSDIYRGEYRIVARLGGKRYRAEHLPPSDELIAQAEQYYLHSPDPYLGWHDPFGPERREQTRQEAFDAEILERVERAGSTFELESVSAAQYAAMF